MRHFLLCSASALYFSVFGATAADCYGQWLLERPRTSGNSKNVAVIFIPFDGTFENKRGAIPVLIQKNSGQFDSSDLSQKWKNGTEYIYSASEVDVGELASFLKASETNGVRSVHFFFPNDPDGGPQTSNHIGINVSGFSDGFGAFQKACASSQ